MDRRFETPIRNTKSASSKLADGSSENQVLLAFFLACWRWLMSPPRATAFTPAFPLTHLSLAAIPAARPRHVLLATIHVPWHSRPSPALA